MYIYKQCSFKDYNRTDESDVAWLGGIAVYDEDYVTDDEAPKLIGVICGCCGGFIETDDLEDIQVYKHWIDIEDCIRAPEVNCIGGNE